MEIYNDTYCVYIHINKINGKKYVGITIYGDNPNRRWQNGYGYKKQVLMSRAIKKYGWENFDHYIIAKNLTKNEACNFEKILIEKLQTRNPKYGYNNTIGGESSFGFHLSEEAKEKLRIINTGRQPWNKGISPTEEQRKKQSEKMKGKRMGSDNIFSKPVVQCEKDWSPIKIWCCTIEVTRKLGIDFRHISSCCLKEYGRQTSGGFRWIYLYDQIKKDGTLVQGAISLGYINENNLSMYIK